MIIWKKLNHIRKAKKQKCESIKSRNEEQGVESMGRILYFDINLRDDREAELGCLGNEACRIRENRNSRDYCQCFGRCIRGKKYNLILGRVK